MKIVHVVTVVSSSGAFGGPLKVATTHLKELSARGHDVLLVGGWDGEGPPPIEVMGVPVRLAPVRQLVPGIGFSGLMGGGLPRLLAREIGAADVAHIHLGRDLVTLWAGRTALRKATPCVVQTHGMVPVRTSPLVRLLDASWTHPVLRGASARFVLTQDERAQLEAQLGAGSPLTFLPNGIDLPAEPSPATMGTDGGRDVVFCARLHPRKRVMAFAEMAAILAPEFPDVRFSVVGPDEGALPALQQLIADEGLADRLVYEGALAYDQVEQRLRRASVYVLPSFQEPFPMSLLEALALGVPCVITHDTGVSAVLAERDAAVVTDGTSAQLADSVRGLLRDDSARAALALRARKTTEEEFAVAAVVDKLAAAYAEAVRR